MLAEITPGDLNRVFFVNSGSEAVDTAMKIALLYHRARGEGQRQRFVSRERSYHGVNIGGVSLSGMVKNRESFGSGLPGVVHMRHTWLEENRFTPGQGEHGEELADDLQRFVDLYGGDTIAACFVEPIAGSTGILVPPRGYLERLRQICDRHGILLVFDEVITGFGRTGKAFAAQTFGVRAGSHHRGQGPHQRRGADGRGRRSATTSTSEITASAPEDGIEFFHGYTYSAHPLACAAGIATQRIFREEGIFERSAELAPYFLERVFDLREIPVIRDIRGYGLLAGIGSRARRGLRPARIRRAPAPLRRPDWWCASPPTTVILAPALIAEREHIDRICDTLRDVLSAL